MNSLMQVAEPSEALINLKRENPSIRIRSASQLGPTTRLGDRFKHLARPLQEGVSREVLCLRQST